MKKIAVFLMLLLVCGAAFGEESDGIVYRLEGLKGPRQRAVITGYTGGAKVVAVNDKIQGVVVSRVAAGAFADLGLSGVDIPSGLDENGLIVENGAFTGNAIDQVYDGNTKSYKVEFLTGGKLKLSNPADTTPDNDRWEHKANALFLYVNDSYATYEGRRLSNDVIKGLAKNVTGKTWEFELRRN
ncbi:MAG: hypothetical protein LBQ57_02290 [Spirochaetales bacterium]|jgi:hypothetical protein|nr:hypothetical protein [Spirochaetales bacterium]